jgi:hypothetical protein
LIGAGIGATIGVGTGVWEVGRIGDQDGSWLASVGGVLLGAAAGGLLDAALHKMSYQLEDVGNTVFAVSPLVGAVIGFNLSRRWWSDPLTVGSLVRFDRGTLHAGIPLLAPSPSGSYLTLASGSF